MRRSFLANLVILAVTVAIVAGAFASFQRKRSSFERIDFTFTRDNGVIVVKTRRPRQRRRGAAASAPATRSAHRRDAVDRDRRAAENAAAHRPEGSAGRAARRADASTARLPRPRAEDRLRLPHPQLHRISLPRHRPLHAVPRRADGVDALLLRHAAVVHRLRLHAGGRHRRHATRCCRSSKSSRRFSCRR